jgi:hypothetical protein
MKTFNEYLETTNNITNINVKEKLDSLQKRSTHEQSQLIWNWIKQDAITFKEFEIIIKSINV